MFLFYDPVLVCLAGPLFSLASCLVFAGLMRKRKLNTIIPILIIFYITLAVGAACAYYGGYKLQVEIAKPYLQSAIKEQCNYSDISVNESEFTFSSGFSWTSKEKSISCRYGGNSWVCDCAHGDQK